MQIRSHACDAINRYKNEYTQGYIQQKLHHLARIPLEKEGSKAKSVAPGAARISRVMHGSRRALSRSTCKYHYVPHKEMSTLKFHCKIHVRAELSRQPANDVSRYNYDLCIIYSGLVVLACTRRSPFICQFQLYGHRLIVLSVTINIYYLPPGRSVLKNIFPRSQKQPETGDEEKF